MLLPYTVRELSQPSGLFSQSAPEIRLPSVNRSHPPPDQIHGADTGPTAWITEHANGYDDIQVTAGIPVVWTIVADEASLNGCNNVLVLPEFNQQIKLEVGTTTITFTPDEPGVYPYTCWMGMPQNTITVTEKEQKAILPQARKENKP